MALDFPTSPVDGQVYENYQWDDTAGVWNLVPSLVQARYVISDTAPLEPESGDAWFNSTDGVTYIYYDDGDSAQWVQTGDPALGYLSLDELSDTNIVAPAIDEVLAYDGTNWVNAPAGGGFTASSTIIAPDASWPVPALGSPIVRVTVIGGGGGRGAAGATSNTGGPGGTTTFDAGGGGSVSASGGVGGLPAQTSTTGPNGTLGNASHNGGGGGKQVTTNFRYSGGTGMGGQVSVQYLNLSGISTVNVAIGGGGAGGTGTIPGGPGGRGEVIVEYVAA